MAEGLSEAADGQAAGDRQRLAAIVAVDLAGYSAATEADEAAAIRAVTALRADIEREASAHGGRVFNTAGDGFMLEFPTASGALAAAEAIAGGASPVRVGVHLGEVSVTPHGDLLGHGVNVAARLQAMARPGALLASETVKRATQGALSQRLTPQGRVRLDKMSETVAVFGLDTKGERKGLVAGAFGRRAARLRPALAAVLVAVTIIAGVFSWRALSGGGELKTAIAPFQVVSTDSASNEVGEMLPARIVAVLTDRQVATVSRDAAAAASRGGARILVSGTVERAGDLIRVHVNLDDRRAGQTLWSGVFERPAADADALEEQIAAKVGDMVSTTTRAFRARAGAIDAETLAAFLRSADQGRGGRSRSAELIEPERRIIERAPDFALGHAYLAYDLAVVAANEPTEIRIKMRREARDQARRALELDPGAGQAYLALAEVEDPDALSERELLLRKGLAVEPQNPGLNINLGDILRMTGRRREAEAFYRRGLALDPLSPSKTATNIFALAGNGDDTGAEQLIERGLRLFPGHVAIRRAAIYTAVLYAPPDRALARIALFRDKGGGEQLLSPDALGLWSRFVLDRRAGRLSPATLRAMAAAADADALDPSNVVAALAMAGGLDAAFAVANAALDRKAALYPSVFFENAAAPMRRDRRFMALAARLALVNYWLKTDRWPDFCSDRTLAYDCRAEASRVAAQWRPIREAG